MGKMELGIRGHARKEEPEASISVAKSLAVADWISREPHSLYPFSHAHLTVPLTLLHQRLGFMFQPMTVKCECRKRNTFRHKYSPFTSHNLFLRIYLKIASSKTRRESKKKMWDLGFYPREGKPWNENCTERQLQERASGKAQAWVWGGIQETS